MQSVIDRFTNAHTCFGQAFSIKKTKVMYTLASGDHYVELGIFVYGKCLEVVKELV